MPEGDTIFRAARAMHRALAGKFVREFRSVLPALNRIDEDAPLAGRTIDAVRASGKHLLIEFSGDLILRTHMRMNGSWHLYRPGERWRRPNIDMRIVISTPDFVAVGFRIPAAEFLTSRTALRQTDLRLIGPDLLGTAFDEDEVIRRMCERPQLPMSDALLNQRVVAGIGNVYKSEVLFICGVSPFRPLSSVGDLTLRRILRKARQLLGANVIDGTTAAIVTYSGFRRTTGRSDSAERLWVYSRGGQPCRKCGTRVESTKQGMDARLTYWCPRCQPDEAGGNWQKGTEKPSG